MFEKLGISQPTTDVSTVRSVAQMQKNAQKRQPMCALGPQRPQLSSCQSEKDHVTSPRQPTNHPLLSFVSSPCPPCSSPSSHQGRRLFFLLQTEHSRITRLDGRLPLRLVHITLRRQPQMARLAHSLLLVGLGSGISSPVGDDHAVYR